ncbi:MAG TPA: MBL fold metallo-hydrolase [Longimicrobium sp.]|nr:MBL fold metallo-hydrolase [Longimicrobium sp.]
MASSTVVPIRFLAVNAYLVMGERPVLVDTGTPRGEKRLVRALAAQGLAPRDLSLILVTHGHFDHAGNAAALRRLTGGRVPLAAHAADEAQLRRGDNGPLKGYGVIGTTVAPVARTRGYEAAPPDLLADEATDLAAFGVHGRLLHTPGHTAGSLSLALDGGDVVAGDLLMGGAFAGFAGLPSRAPGWPIFADQREALVPSLAKAMASSPPWVHVGHGGPLEGAAVRRFLDRQPPAPR